MKQTGLYTEEIDKIIAKDILESCAKNPYSHTKNSYYKGSEYCRVANALIEKGELQIAKEDVSMGGSGDKRFLYISLPYKYTIQIPENSYISNILRIVAKLIKNKEQIDAIILLRSVYVLSKEFRDFIDNCRFFERKWHSNGEVMPLTKAKDIVLGMESGDIVFLREIKSEYVHKNKE